MLSGTGARISESVGMRVCDFELRGGRHVVRILGKGRKERALPMWPEIARELSAFVRERGFGDGDFVFAGRNVGHMSRSGARGRIDAAVYRATATHPQLAGKRVSAHVFRRSCAMGMLEADVDLSTTAIWLGHENVQTTHRYTVADMARGEATLSKAHRGDASEAVRKRYVPKGDVLDFLTSL